VVDRHAEAASGANVNGQMLDGLRELGGAPPTP
jgi:hypothetical protein